MAEGPLPAPLVARTVQEYSVLGDSPVATTCVSEVVPEKEEEEGGGGGGACDGVARDVSIAERRQGRIPGQCEVPTTSHWHNILRNSTGGWGHDTCSTSLTQCFAYYACRKI